MTDKLRELLEDAQTVYEGKRMVVHPNSFDQLRMEVIKLDNINRLQGEQLTKAKDLLLRFIELKNKPCAVGHSVNMLLYENICADVKQFLKDSEVEK